MTQDSRDSSGDPKAFRRTSFGVPEPVKAIARQAASDPTKILPAGATTSVHGPGAPKSRAQRILESRNPWGAPTEPGQMSFQFSRFDTT